MARTQTKPQPTLESTERETLERIDRIAAALERLAEIGRTLREGAKRSEALIGACAQLDHQARALARIARSAAESAERAEQAAARAEQAAARIEQAARSTRDEEAHRSASAPQEGEAPHPGTKRPERAAPRPSLRTWATAQRNTST